MAGITNTQLMTEMRDMRIELYQRMDEVKDNVHDLTTKVAVYVTKSDALEIAVNKNVKALFGNDNNPGIKNSVKAQDKKEESRIKSWLDVRTALIVFGLTALGQYIISLLIL